MPPRQLDPKVIEDLYDVVEVRILEKTKEKFRFEIVLMKRDMIVEIISAIGGVPQHMGTKDGSEKATEDFEVVGLSGEDRIDRFERSVGNRVGQFDSFVFQLKLTHKMQVSNFSGTLKPKDLNDWIGELEDYFELEELKIHSE